MTDKNLDTSRAFVLPTANVYEPGTLAQSTDPASVAASTGCCEPATVAAGCCEPTAQPVAEAGCCGSAPQPATAGSCC